MCRDIASYLSRLWGLWNSRHSEWMYGDDTNIALPASTILPSYVGILKTTRVSLHRSRGWFLFPRTRGRWRYYSDPPMRRQRLPSGGNPTIAPVQERYGDIFAPCDFGAGAACAEEPFCNAPSNSYTRSCFTADGTARYTDEDDARPVDDEVNPHFAPYCYTRIRISRYRYHIQRKSPPPSSLIVLPSLNYRFLSCYTPPAPEIRDLGARKYFTCCEYYRVFEIRLYPDN